MRKFGTPNCGRGAITAGNISEAREGDPVCTSESGDKVRLQASLDPTRTGRRQRQVPPDCKVKINLRRIVA